MRHSWMDRCGGKKNLNVLVVLSERKIQDDTSRSLAQAGKHVGSFLKILKESETRLAGGKGSTQLDT